MNGFLSLARIDLLWLVCRGGCSLPFASRISPGGDFHELQAGARMMGFIAAIRVSVAGGSERLPKGFFASRVFS